jgi:hypothetical protein
MKRQSKAAAKSLTSGETIARRGETRGAAATIGRRRQETAIREVVTMSEAARARATEEDSPAMKPRSIAKAGALPQPAFGQSRTLKRSTRFFM